MPLSIQTHFGAKSGWPKNFDTESKDLPTLE
jgi:hypothetical protein